MLFSVDNMEERKGGKTQSPQIDLETWARRFGAYLYDLQKRIGFGALELQERMYSATRSKSGVHRGLRTTIWEGYIKRSSEEYTAAMKSS